MHNQDGKPQKPPVRDLARKFLQTKQGGVPERVGRNEEVQPRYRFYGGNWWFWNGRCYEKSSDKRVRAGVWDTFENLTRRDADDVVHAIDSLVFTEGSMPQWTEDHKGQPDPELLVPLENGLLDLQEYINDRIVLHKPTPRFFSSESADYPFDPDATCPRWNQFLDEVFGESEPLPGGGIPEAQRRKDLLQEWFGYCLSHDTRAEKMLLLIGPPASGKSTTTEVLKYVLGANRVGATSLQALGSNFGVYPLLGQTVCILGDARVDRRTNVEAATERLLSIIGRDPQEVNPKHRDQFQVPLLPVKFVMSTNDLPNLPDPSGAFRSRLLCLKYGEVNRFDRSGGGDPNLKKTLRDESAGILLWALEGYRRLVANNHQFTEVDDDLDVKRELEDNQNALAPFIRDCLILGDNFESSKADVYNLYMLFCNLYDERPLTEQHFSRKLIEFDSNIVPFRPRINGTRIQHWKHVGIAPDWRETVEELKRG